MGQAGGHWWDGRDRPDNTTGQGSLVRVSKHCPDCNIRLEWRIDRGGLLEALTAYDKLIARSGHPAN